MTDSYFREILGVDAAAGHEEIRRAYRRLVMENHPDRFPPEQKPVQELRLITLNEAYASLITAVRSPRPAARERAAGARAAAGGEAGSGTRDARTPGGPPRPADSSVGFLKDTAYAWYKQGFIHFSIAIHGIAELNRTIAEQKLPSFRPYRAAQDFANSLSLLKAAHDYFLRVVERFPGSMWASDARMKLRRIERFTKLYRRILSNMRGPDVPASGGGYAL